MPYQPSLDSLRSHPLPTWFDDAKLGIFVHWTPASVPAWAPLTGEMADVVARRGWRYWMAHNPYAEWYANSLRIKGSPTQRYHQQTFGEHFPYEAFVPQFIQAHTHWHPSAWAETFADAGARYIVFVAKHHDGFLLWPSRYPNPRQAGFSSPRDVIGELTSAVRARGMRMGLYYSSGLDWTFDARPITDLPDLIAAIPRNPEYAAHVDAHWRELIERYQPSVLWNDIGYPPSSNLLALFADYYNAVPEGVVNDRFRQFSLAPERSLRYRLTLGLIKVMLPLLMKRARGVGAPAPIHADFRTPEYTVARKITADKWEACRGMGYSFGYNQQETESHLIAPDALVRLLADVVSKNGNLLLNVGPMADGTIPEPQLRRLRALGNWLKVNGEAIYGSRPWTRAEGSTADGIPVRFTRRGEMLYAILLGTPTKAEVVLKQVTAPPGATVALLGGASNLPWRQAGADLAVALPDKLLAAPAHVLRIAGRDSPQKGAVSAR